jgi:uncharacterized membrane protein YfcA
LILIVIGILVGFSAGLLGIGGGFFMVPLQYFLLTSIGLDSDLAMRISIGTSLAIIAPTTLSGAYTHQHNLKNILSSGILLGIFGMIGGVLGGIVSSYLPVDILKIILGLVLILAAISMLIDTEGKSSKRLKLSIYTAIFVGGIIGFSSGLLGIGGGIALIPILVFLLGFSMRESVGISSIFTSLTVIGGTATYIMMGWGINTISYSLGYVNLIHLLIIAAFSIPTAYFSSKLVYKMPEKRLKQIFAIVLFYLGINLLGFDLLSILFGIINIL